MLIGRITAAQAEQPKEEADEEKGAERKEAHGRKEADERKGAVVELLKELVIKNPWVTFSVLNFPVTINDKINSFVSFLI